MRPTKNKKKTLYVLVLIAIFSMGFAMIGLSRSLNNRYVVSAPLEKTVISHEAIADPTGNKPVPTITFSKEHPASMKPVVRWSDVDEAVFYEIELGEQYKNGEITPFYTTRKVYTNGYNVALPEGYKGDTFSWRVRGMDLDGTPVSDWSDWETVYLDRELPIVQKPVPTAIYNQGRGTVLLYPVYGWIPVNGAVKYELEILNAPPENPNGITPSEHRIDSAIVDYAEHYDEKARYSESPFYWRARGLDGDGNPVGVYSDAISFVTNPADNYGVATYGDSITHGGGSISYSPADWDFSYQHYLNFESINLAHSGDTSAMTVERFEKDVLPFHPRYLIILMGSNSLRAGVSAEEVIEDMKTLKQKCLDNNILPVFLTVPPLNPANIQRAFDEGTAEGWQERIAIVNAYILTQVHIDDAAGMADENGLLPTKLGLDGLHLDQPGKKMMAEAINRAWPDIIKLPESEWSK